MSDAATAVLSKLAALLDMDAETILTQSLQGFVAEKLTQVQQRMSQLYLEQQRFVRKYGMSLDAFLRTLEALEDQSEEDTTVQGVPLLEAVADSRWWAHVQEDLATATATLEQLQALHK
jgi:hypothetical protein